MVAVSHLINLPDLWHEFWTAALGVWMLYGPSVSPGDSQDKRFLL